MAAGDTVSKKCMIPRGPDVSYMPWLILDYPETVETQGCRNACGTRNCHVIVQQPLFQIVSLSTACVD